MKWLLFLMFFFLLGAFFIISNNNLHVGNPEQFNSFMTQYYGWFFKIAENAGSVTGYMVNVDWMP
jgi:hypothetical protein